MPVCQTSHGRISYTRNGVATDDPALVLIHGAGGQARDWPTEWRYGMNAVQTLGIRSLPLASAIQGRSVLALDLPGHGNAGGNPLTSVGAYADAVSEFVAKTCPAGAVLVGHSLGGGIAITAAARGLANVAGLVVVGSAATLPVSPQILDGLQSAFADTVGMITRYAWAKTAPAVFRETGRRRMLAAGPAVVHTDFAACADYDASSMLGRIEVPTAIIAGGEDRMVSPANSEALSKAIAGSEYHVVAGAGHFLHVEKTEEVGRLLTDFVARRCRNYGG